MAEHRSGAEPRFESPIPVPSDFDTVGAIAGQGDLTLADESHARKQRVVTTASHAAGSTPFEGVGLGRARRGEAGLVFCTSPDEWSVHGGPSRDAAPSSPTSGYRSIDLTHLRVVIRLTGRRSVDLLAKLCALDLDDRMFPDGSAARIPVASVATEIVRDDHNGQSSYLLVASRSFGRFLFDAILDAGAEYGVHHVSA